MKTTKTKIINKFFSTLIYIIVSISLLIPATFFSTTNNLQKAYAYQTSKLFSWTTEINATINTDGSISVAESKIIDITKFIEKAKSYVAGNQETPKNPNLNPLVWSFMSFPEEADLTLSDAKIAILSNEDTIIGNWSNIPSATFLSKWNGEEGPSVSTYTYNEENKQMFIFTELTNSEKLSAAQCAGIMQTFTGSSDPKTWITTKAIMNLNYTINRAANIYKDVADFSWNYVSDTWIYDSYNVKLNITIPVGNTSIPNPLGKITSIEQQTEAKTERNIYAWGHGSSSGIVDLNPAGLVTINNDIVPGNSDAQIRVVFPSSWLTNLDLGSNISQQNQTKLTTILKEESVWRDDRTDAVNKLLLPIAFSVICIIILVLCVVILAYYKKRFIAGSISANNLEDMHPCLLVRLKNWNREYSHDLVVSLLYLNQNKKIKISRLASGDFTVRLKNSSWAKNAYKTKSLNIIDKRTINFIFGIIACGNPLIRLSDIQNYARARSYDFMSNYLAWHSLLTDEVNEFANFKSAFDKIRHAIFFISISLALISIILGFWFLDIITPIIGVICSFIIAFIGNSLRNKIYFKDNKGTITDVSDIKIGLAHYTNLTDQFRICAINTIKQSVLDAQDIISKWNLENIS